MHVSVDSIPSSCLGRIGLAVGLLLLVPLMMQIGCASGGDPRPPAVVSRIRESSVLLGIPDRFTYSSATALGGRVVLTTRHSTEGRPDPALFWHPRAGVFVAESMQRGNGEIPPDSEMRSIAQFLERSTRDWRVIRVPVDVPRSSPAAEIAPVRVAPGGRLRSGDVLLVGGHLVAAPATSDSLEEGTTFRLGYGEVIECTPEGIIKYRSLGGDPIDSGMSGGPIFTLVEGEPFLVGITIGEYNRFLFGTTEVGLCIPHEVVEFLAIVHEHQ